MNNVVLIGFMGSGKSSVGKVLADKLERNFIDMDDEIEVGEEKSINEIFEAYGEEHFRELETSYLEKLLTKKNKVIATGGGVILKEENVSILKRIGTVVFLHTPLDQLLNNLQDDTKRPLLKDEDHATTIKNLLNLREPIYFEASNMIIQTKDKSIEEIADEIVSLL
ncbi:shikimate kinase [Vallitaleaceae bacterium 9-2]